MPDPSTHSERSSVPDPSAHEDLRIRERLTTYGDGTDGAWEPPVMHYYRQDVAYLLSRLAKLEAVAEARDVFLAASVTVWREIDRLADEHGTYPGLPESVAIRRAEKAAWERYRDVLDSTL